MTVSLANAGSHTHQKYRVAEKYHALVAAMDFRRQRSAAAMAEPFGLVATVLKRCPAHIHSLSTVPSNQHRPTDGRHCSQPGL